MAKRTRQKPDAEFIEIWNGSDSAGQVARRCCRKKASVINRAAKLRQKGKVLKHFPSSNPADVGKAAYIPTLEEIEEAKVRLRAKWYA